MDETQEKYLNFGWLFTLVLAFVVKHNFPTLAEEAALVIVFTPMLILLIILAPGKDSEAAKDIQ
ncbi:MAG: hypothetical protein HN975_01005 [Anaerolineae bacterium]|jgi:hypothetical protein|nr:hypothetical protein [Anaerolineae bacterium]